jgi:S1-C subfamily serine protease
MFLKRSFRAFASLVLALLFSLFLINSASADAAVNLLPENFIVKAIDRTGPAVVRINTERLVTDTSSQELLLKELFGIDTLPRQERKEVLSGQGSGFIIDADGVLLTNAHVVDKADKVTVTLKDGRVFNGKVQGVDELTDLAVVKIDPKGENLPIAPLGDSAKLKVGDWAIAVGNPLGLDNTVTIGIISTLDRSAAKVGIRDKRIDFLQTDAAINPGNSGGPLLNAEGEVIGINTAIRADANGIGFAIPINKAKSLESYLAEGKKVPHPYIGIGMVNLTPEAAKENNNDPNSQYGIIPEVNGILIVNVVKSSPAQKAGLRRGDVVVAVNDNKVSDGQDLQAIVENTGVNQSLKLKIQRGDSLLDLKVETAQMENLS